MFSLVETSEHLGPEETAMLWIAVVKVSCVIRPMVIADLECIAFGFDICVPADSFKDRVNAVVFTASVDSLKSILHKQIPNVRVFLMPIPPLVF